MSQILIVDDQPIIRRLLAMTLGKDYEVLEAENGVQALERVRLNHPKVVLLDVMMPGVMNGLQVLDAIKGNPSTRDIFVAMVSARGQAADSEDAYRRGADAYFVKPFSPQQLLTWIRSKLPNA